MEASFFRHLEAEVEKHPRDAQIGGVPSIVNKVRGYVKLRAGKRNLVPEDKALTSVNDEFCWAVVFYLLRSGHPNGAMAYVQSNATEFRNLDRNFATYLANYAKHEDRRLTGPLHDRINAEYNQRATISPENSVDPFRLACYKIIGRCDLSHRALDGINTDTEDWIWLQFNLARESSRSDEPANEAFGLADVRETVQDIGRRYFEKGAPDPMGGHGTFFLLQILAGLFEHAVVFLQAFSYISAVHFAIALDFYGLLRVSGADASDDELRKSLQFSRTALYQLLILSASILHSDAHYALTTANQFPSPNRLLHPGLPYICARSVDRLPHPHLSQCYAPGSYWCITCGDGPHCPPRAHP